ncbi:hypothetical protein N2152v2_007143 [Parachlorella kessleri]
MDTLPFGPGSSQGSPDATAAEADLCFQSFDCVDVFLDDYLKDVPDGACQDPFGNFAIDVGALGPFSAPLAECQPQQATTLTSDFQTATLATANDAVTKPSGKGCGQRKGSQARGQNGSKEPLDAKNMRKQLALQEKNRRAQRRFRERQKQRVEELSGQVEALTAQLNAVLAEKGSLESRNGVLENMLAVREKQLEAAVRGEPVDVKASQVATATAAGAERPAHSGGGGASSDAASTQDADELAAAFSEDLTLSVREGEPTTLTAGEVKGMTPAELAKYYKAYVNELAGCLVETNGQPASPERIKCLVDEVCLLVTRVALCNPAGVKHFTLTKVVEDVSGGQQAQQAQHADDRVPQVVRALAISPQQRTQLGQLRRLFLQKLAKIVADRKEVNAQLMGAVPGGTSHRQMAVRYLAAHDVVRKLRDNMREEHILVLDFVSTIFKHVFAAQQVAQFMIHSFPYTPDCLALSTWVAAEDGDAEALSMLAAEAQGKQQQAQQAALSQGHAGLPAMAAQAPGAQHAQQQAACLQPGVPSPASVFGLPDQSAATAAAMFASNTSSGHHHHFPPAAIFGPGQVPLLPNGQALIGNVAVSAAQLMHFAPGALMPIPASSFSTGATLVNNLNGMIKPGSMPPLATARSGCFPADLAPAGMLPVSPHVVTMTSSSR